MKAFQIPPWRRAQLARQLKSRDTVTNHAVQAMEQVMKDAIDHILKHSLHTGKFSEPNLSAMFHVSEGFYRNVVKSAFNSVQDEKKDQQGRKRLSKLPLGLPRNLNSLEKFFRDKNAWPKVVKRSQLLTARLQRAYLQKLRRKFKTIMPRILNNELSIEDAKKDMMGAWQASKSRVETIFRTETTKYFCETQVRFFEDDDEIIGFLFDSTSDSVRTSICRSRHGLIYRPGTDLLRQNTPACHYNCRSHLIALANTSFNRKMLEDKARDPSRVKVVPLPPGWNNSKSKK